MEIKGSVALVTGANRGLGKAYVEALMNAGAAKVYAAMREPSVFVEDARLKTLKLDVTSPEDVEAAVRQCPDLTLLINNAGVMLTSPIMAEDAERALRRELEVNVIGPLRLSRSFAPALKTNGGGAIVNVLSVVSWFVFPFAATYSVSKHAALAATEALRIELNAQKTQVIGVFAGFIDTDMAAQISGSKSKPETVVQKTIQALHTGVSNVLADQRAEEIWKAMRLNPASMSVQMQAAWTRAKVERAKRD